MKTVRPTKPRARREGLIVQTLPDETLVYDLDRDLAHCLNQSASLVWNYCDGRNTTKQIVRAVSVDLDHPVDEKFVWLALDQLGRNHLLDEMPVAPPQMAKLDRRTAMRALGLSAAVAIPIVASIVAPSPAQAASGCATGGQSCAAIPCCSGFICNGSFICQGS